jgi:hypothetical protein
LHQRLVGQRGQNQPQAIDVADSDGNPTGSQSDWAGAGAPECTTWTHE